MSFEIIREDIPSAPWTALSVIVVLAVLLVGLAAVYAWLLVSGTGNDYLMGSIMALEFLIAGIEVLLCGRFLVGFREVSEDRQEELLW